MSADSMIQGLNCDCCGSPMEMKKHDVGASFICAACGQDWLFDENGSSPTILARLYPSNMGKDSKMYDEFLSYRLSEFIFSAKAKLLCGLITEREYAAFVSEAEAKVSAARYVNPPSAWGKVKAWLRRLPGPA